MTDSQVGVNFYKAIYAYFVRRVSTVEIAEDLTQEVFLKISSSYTKKEILTFKSWIFTIAKNTLIDHYRKRKSDEEFKEEIHSPEDIEDETHNEISNCIVSMMSSLGPEDEMILRSAELEEMSQKNLSEKLEMNYTTLKSKVQRARINLHKKLSYCCNFEKDSRGNTSFCKKKLNGSC